MTHCGDEVDAVAVNGSTSSCDCTINSI